MGSFIEPQGVIVFRICIASFREQMWKETTWQSLVTRQLALPSRRESRPRDSSTGDPAKDLCVENGETISVMRNGELQGLCHAILKPYSQQICH